MTKELELNIKMREVTSLQLPRKMKSNMSDYSYVYRDPRCSFPCIDSFTNEPVVQCDVQVLK